jgi:hypothetical protein
MRLHTAPNWKFYEFKHGDPSAIFDAPESAGRMWVVLPALLARFGVVRA